MVSFTKASNASIRVKSMPYTLVSVVALIVVCKAEVLATNVAIKVVLKFMV